MIKKVRIAVDHGNRNMKTCSQVFTTGLTIQDKKPARGEKFLFYEGKYYVLSENRIPYQRDKTQDDRFFILTLFAIVKELEENDCCLLLSSSMHDAVHLSLIHNGCLCHGIHCHTTCKGVKL